MRESIGMYLHCKTCLMTKPGNISPRDWAKLNVGWTKAGLQVWCVRCDKNVMALDFLGQKVAYDDEDAPSRPLRPKRAA